LFTTATKTKRTIELETFNCLLVRNTLLCTTRDERNLPRGEKKYPKDEEGLFPNSQNGSAAFWDAMNPTTLRATAKSTMSV
jgi:hypothetical protein